MAIALKAENVSIRYITGDFKDIGLKEYTVRKITRNYHVKEFMAVDGVSFALEQGDMLGIIGSNGAGKSTLLKAVAGIMEPTRGKITTKGEVAALLELGSGFDGDLTVKENAYLRGAMLGYTKEFMDQTYDQIIDFAELREFEDRPFKQLSSGMKSRLAFSIASLVKPDILILDEVLSVGDGAFQEKSAKKMREIIGQGATTILVSHSLSQIRELCNKVLWLDHGKQVAFGETEVICDQYERFLRGECPAEMVEEIKEKKDGKDSIEKKIEEAQSMEENGEVTEQGERKKHTLGPAGKLRIFEKRWKKMLPGFLILLYVGLLGCIFLQNKYLESNKKVIITTQTGSGTVTFRGAQVDNTWYDPQDITISAEGWSFGEEENILTDTAGAPLELNLPIGRDRFLVFNVGPEEGNVNISVNQSAFEHDLYRAERAELGERIYLPYVRFSNKTKLSAASACVLFLLMGAMLACNIYFKREKGEGRKEGRNSAIEFLRFFIIMCVVVHHYCGRAPAGYLGVDFFFLLSGFLLMKHFADSDVAINEGPALTAAKYTKGRYLRILPYYLIAFFLSLVLSVCMWRGGSLAGVIENNFWELLMLEAFGFTENLIVGPGWYCSALIIAGFCIYFLLAKNQKTYLYVVAPISLFLIFAWMDRSLGNLNRWLQYDTFISTGVLRGFAEMGLGCISYQIYKWLRTKNVENRVASTTFEFICFSYIIYIIFKVGPSQKDFVCVFAMAALIISVFVGNSLWSELLNNRLSRFLGSISIGIYLNHQVIAGINWYGICSHFGISWGAAMLVYLLVTVAFSAISTRFVKNLIRARKA